MPLNKIHVPEHLPSETCHAINNLLHDSLVVTCGVKPDDFFSLICRYNVQDMILHPTFLGERDPENTIIIEITLLAGREDAKKEALFKEVRKRLEGIGFNPNNSIMFLLENQIIDWSFTAAGSDKSLLGL